ncbi:hypothetical protein SteCoe_25081 [Stentor coeruleus]|uniref:MalT-like TPR region domain-containing protein n=1 Tax=Stentor coeruleus TaxID=5963 RepID=A0A1R2BG09_9CILI|nr:hypothetical protein SteCoe_25081 [Stentor coeruleus]
MFATFSNISVSHTKLNANLKKDFFPSLYSKKLFDIQENFGEVKSSPDESLNQQSLRTASFLIDMATDFIAKNNLNQASECLTEAHIKLETIPDKNSQKTLSLYKEIGMLYYSIKDLVRADTFLLKSIPFIQYFDPSNEALDWIHYGLLMIEKKDADAAVAYCINALNILKDNSITGLTLAKSHEALGLAYDLKKNYIKSQENYDEALSIISLDNSREAIELKAKLCQNYYIQQLELGEIGHCLKIAIDGNDALKKLENINLRLDYLYLACKRAMHVLQNPSVLDSLLDELIALIPNLEESIQANYYRFAVDFSVLANNFEKAYELIMKSIKIRMLKKNSQEIVFDYLKAAQINFSLGLISKGKCYLELSESLIGTLSQPEIMKELNLTKYMHQCVKDSKCFAYSE